MKHRHVLNVLSIAALFQADALLLPLVMSCVFHESQVRKAIFIQMICEALFGSLLHQYVRRHRGKQDLHTPERLPRRGEAYRGLMAGWIFLCLSGALPYYFSGLGISFNDAWFCSVSAWTTTGARLFSPSVLPESLELWTAMNFWFGGGFMLFLTILILPRLSVSEEVLSGDTNHSEYGRFSPKLRQTFRIAVIVYLCLTAAAFALFIPSGLKPYDAVLNALTSVSTSGFFESMESTGFRPSSVYLRGILAVIALLSSINYFVYYGIFHEKSFRPILELEVRTYGFAIGMSTLLMGIALRASGTFHGAAAFGNAFIQSLSFSSTAGFALFDTGSWPTLCKILMILLGITGGCMFSSASGIKVGRAVVVLKLARRGIFKRIHPDATKPVLVDNRVISARKASSITAYILLYCCIFVIGFLAFGLEDLDMETTLSVVLGSLTNCGTFFGKTVAGDYSILSAPGRFFSTILMVTGRLEIYPVIVMFSRTFWQDNARKFKSKA